SAARTAPRRSARARKSACPSAEHLAGIHDALRVESRLEPPHQRELERGLVARELLALQLADSVLGRDGAAEACDEVVHDAIGDGGVVHEWRGVRTCGRGEIVVQVAIAEVPEYHESHARQRLRQRFLR